jgi:hypothetical protein
MKKALYLARYKRMTNTTVVGRAKSGEISPKGLVAHTEDWEGRITAAAAPPAIRYIREPDGHVRPMTFKELVDRGFFIVAKGPTGIRKQNEGIR